MANERNSSASALAPTVGSASAPTVGSALLLPPFREPPASGTCIRMRPLRPVLPPGLRAGMRTGVRTTPGTALVPPSSASSTAADSGRGAPLGPLGTGGQMVTPGMGTCAGRQAARFCTSHTALAPPTSTAQGCPHPQASPPIRLRRHILTPHSPPADPTSAPASACGSLRLQQAGNARACDQLRAQQQHQETAQ